MPEGLISVLLLQTRPEDERLEALSGPWKENGYWVDNAWDIEEADTYLDQNEYDIFLADISHISLGECVKLFRRLQPLPTETIVISDRVNEKFYQNASNLGVSGILSEPVNPVVLEGVVASYAKNRGHPAPGRSRS